MSLNNTDNNNLTAATSRKKYTKSQASPTNRVQATLVYLLPVWVYLGLPSLTINGPFMINGFSKETTNLKIFLAANQGPTTLWNYKLQNMILHSYPDTLKDTTRQSYS